MAWAFISIYLSVCLLALFCMGHILYTVRLKIIKPGQLMQLGGGGNPKLGLRDCIWEF